MGRLWCSSGLCSRGKVHPFTSRHADSIVRSMHDNPRLSCHSGPVVDSASLVSASNPPKLGPGRAPGLFLSAVEQCVERRADLISASAEPMVNGYGVEVGVHHLGTKKMAPTEEAAGASERHPMGLGG